MPIANVLQPIGSVPTEPSLRAATRNAMLNTIHDRVQHSQELHEAADHVKEPQQNSSIISKSHVEQPVEASGVNMSPSVGEKLQPPSLNYRYEIATLIELGETLQDSSKVLLNVKPEAIAENLFQYMGIAPDLRPPPRSRGLTDISNNSRRSIMSSNGTNEWDPSRQPRPTPWASSARQASRLQQHEGFVRFLKQHASPPHQRVTAGGRIVPTGPLSPPPMFDYASLNGLVRQQQVKSHATNGFQTNSPFNYQPDTAPAVNLTRSPRILSTTNGVQPAKAQTVIDQGMIQATVNNGDKPHIPQPFMGPAAALALTQLSMVHLGFFPDGTALISCNGVCYRSYWNDVSTIMEPITIGQPVPTMNIPALQYPLTSSGQSIHNGEPTATMMSSASDLKETGHSPENPTITSFRTSQPISHTDHGDPHIEEKSLRAQLTSLDKYLALHHYDIGPPERMNLVSQRKTLVEAIAKLRSHREPSTQMIPIIDGRRLGNRKSSTRPMVSVSREVSVDVDRALKKSLSPSAPAFVPSSASVFSPGNPKPDSSTLDSFAVTLGGPSAIKDTIGASIVTDKFAEGKSLHSTSSTSQTEPFVEVDPWDPAMRIVPASMITYAQRHHAETTAGDKKYCTTVEEFQEAIRRVREQARMWGCVGGNSKDPAYDAEEDIWYAIKDEYPIPLPTKTPDHIICPRPWNWYDSTFNVNATVEPQINMHSGHLRKQVHPESMAMSTKYSLEHTEPQNKKKLEPTRDAGNRCSANSTGSDCLPQINGTLAMPSEETERYQIQQHKPITPTRRTNSKSIDVRIQSTIRKDAVAHGPSSPRLQGDYPQKDNDVHLSNTGGQSTPWPSPAQAIATIYGREQQSLRPLSPYPISPSSVAISAAQAAYGAKHLASKSPFSGQCESISDQHFVSCHGTRTMVAAGSRLVQKSKVARNSSTHRATLSPLLESEQRGTLQGIAITTDLHQRQDLADELSTKSRGEWGPAEVCAAAEEDAPKVRIPRPLSQHEAVGSRHHTSRTRESKLASKPVEYSGVASASNLGLASIAGSLTTSTYTFLKDMLKSPRYSSGFRRQYHGSKEKLADDEGAQVRAEMKPATVRWLNQPSGPQTIEKENFSSIPENLRGTIGLQSAGNKPCSTSYAYYSKSMKNSQEPCILNANKANSSLASSAYHAQGYLPPCDGSGKERATSIYQAQLKEKPYTRPRVNLPASSSHARLDQSDDRSDQRRSMDQALYNIDIRHMPAILGYDGSEDPLPDDDSTYAKGKGKEKAKSSSDCKDVTSADFDQHRPDHDNEWHRGAVSDFFRELHEKEVRYMMARQRKNTKTAP